MAWLEKGIILKSNGLKFSWSEEVSYYPSGKETVDLVLCFDNGPPYTFMKRSSALRVGRPVELVEPELFGGLGRGDFQSKEVILLHIKLLEFWCRQWAYVVEDDILERDYDVLAGHDFMQLYGIKLLPHKGDIEIDEVRLRLAQRVRSGRNFKRKNYLAAYPVCEML